MVPHSVLTKAQAGKKDEFYTKLVTIEKEMAYHPDDFRGKRVYCNSDDYRESQFWRFFRDNFDELGLEALVATGFSEGSRGSIGTVERVGGTPVESHGLLLGNGDFRSDECLELLAASDTVSTNPPFSLLGEFIPLMYEMGKEFLILGNQNAFTYKDVYPHLDDGTLKMGFSIHSGGTEFVIGDEYPLKSKNGARIDADGNRCVSVTGVRWLTNFENAYVAPKMDFRTMEENVDGKLVSKFEKKFGTDPYPFYDNHPGAREVMFTRCMPTDFDCVMGVPITFMDKYRPEDHVIVGFRKGLDGRDLKVHGRVPYFRVLVKWREAA